jgi:hypothetical protein
MSAVIKLKRGSTEQVSNYTELSLGEMILDYTTGQTFIKRLDETKIPLDQSFIINTDDSLDNDSNSNGSVFINTNNGMSYMLTDNVNNTFKQLSGDIKLQSKEFDTSYIIPDNNVASLYGPLNCSDDFDIKIGKNSELVIN